MAVVIDGTNGITTPLDVEIQGSTSGSIIIAAPAVAGTNTQTLVAATGTLAPLIAGTAVASTSGTSIDFTSIPSWVKRITVMFQGVSTSGTSSHLLQLGSGSVQTSGYVSLTTLSLTAAYTGTSTAGMVSFSDTATYAKHGTFVFTNLNSNIWVMTGIVINTTGTALGSYSAGSVSLSGALDRVRITTVNGTDTFDAGSINILYE